MAADDTFKRWRSTRKGVRESLGLKKRSTSKENAAEDKESLVKLYFHDYETLANTSWSERKIAKVREKVLVAGLATFKDSDIKFALSYVNGNADEAFDFLDLIENAHAGKLEPYSPDVKLLGAENNNAVTCYLDSVLFAILGRLDDFQAMLYHTFDDPPRRRLVCLLRLWVNCLRRGNLIIAAFMAQIQSALADCGWKEAGLRQQQDASEAFNFITDVLDLPRLTLKKDMFHQGKADQDDHKYTNERTIDVGIPEPQQGRVITLEECMLEYFDERVVVERQREVAARRNTIGASPGPPLTRPDSDMEKPNKALHVEVSELTASTPSTPTEILPAYQGRPHLTGLDRTPSIFEDKKLDIDDRTKSPTRQNSLPSSGARKRAATIGKTVKMPAFQFFRLIPWYTEGNPNTDLQVAQHFESKRPTVGICLKRFGQRNDGTFYKRTDNIDIPLETGIPEFLHDDDFSEERFPNHKFKLSLQSIICHKGDTIQRGHYISYVRAERPLGLPPMDDSLCPLQSTPDQDPWLKFDDLATPKIRYVDIKAELERECPYMLFYKIALRGGDDKPGRVSMDGRPPSYSSEGAESSVRSTDPLPNSAGPGAGSNLTELERSTSGGSSVISATSGPPVAITENAALAGHGVPVVVEPRSDSVAVPEVTSIQPIEQGAVEIRAHSVPANTAALPATTQAESVPPSANETKQSSRASTADKSGTGSIGRSLGSLFRPRSGSKGRGSISTNRTSMDLNPSGLPIAGAENVKTPPAVQEEASDLTTKDSKDSEKATPRKSIDLGSAFGRKSMDGGRLGRRKEKSSSRRERGLGGKLKNDKSDRECSIM